MSQDVFSQVYDIQQQRKTEREADVTFGNNDMTVAPVVYEGRLFYPQGDAPKKDYGGDFAEAGKDLFSSLGTMAAGGASAVFGAPVDLAGLLAGIGSAIFPGDKGRAEAFADTFTKFSEFAGSEALLNPLRDAINNSDMSGEDKQQQLDILEQSSIVGLPGVVPASKSAIKGVKSYIDTAPDRVAERATGTTLTSGIDPTKVVDDIITAQARYFETGNYEPPTKENPVSVVKPTEDEPGIIAFHGSGADFDEFSLEMIGTGEGAQAYGHGLYFTDSESIANFYRTAVSSPELVKNIPDDPTDVAGNLALDIPFTKDSDGNFQINSSNPDYADFIQTLDDNSVKTDTMLGRDKIIYEFNDGSIIGLQKQNLATLNGKPLDSVYTQDVENSFAKEIDEITDKSLEMGIAGIDDYDEMRDKVQMLIANMSQGFDNMRDVETSVEMLSPGFPNMYGTIYEYFVKDKVDVSEISTLSDLGQKKGKTYKVGLTPKPDELLDYDKPFSEQTKEIQNKLLSIGYEPNPDTDMSGGMILETIMSNIAQQVSAINTPKLEKINEQISVIAKQLGDNINATDEQGQRLVRTYNELIKKRDALPKFKKEDARKLASQEMSAAGIPGIKYRAAGSRSAATADEAAERNYVIFDDKAIKILEKYGIVGPVAVTATAVGMKQEEQTDGT